MCLLPVVSEQGGVLVEAGRADSFDRACDRGVDPCAPLGELGLVGDLLRQRMLEGVFHSRVERLFVDEASPLERAQGRSEVVVGRLGNAPQN